MYSMLPKHFNSLLSIVFAFVSLLALSASAAAQGEEYFGKFEPELRFAPTDLVGAVLKLTAAPSAYKFARPIEAGAKISAGQIYDPRDFERKLTVLLIAPPSSERAPMICADMNTDVVFAVAECQTAIAVAGSNDFETILNLPISSALFKTFPVYLRLLKDFKNPNLGANDKVVMQSTGAFAVGRVNIKNRNVLVEYKFPAASSVFSTTEGLFGIDADADGKINFAPFSLESAYAYKEEVVFRLGQSFVSTSRIDTEKNQIVMRERLPAEYKRVELKVGETMPDFAFTDFAEKKRSLSEFRKKYLLVDFWGLWCVDCRRQLPFQIAAYQKFRSRGFEILGMDSDEDIEPVKTFLAENKITWTQAKPDSIKALTETSYRIQEYPSSILLAPDGKVLILDQKQLHDEQLLKTLERLLPKQTRNSQLSGQSAVGRKRLSGNVTRFVRAEPNDGAGDFYCVGGAFHRNLINQLRHLFGKMVKRRVNHFRMRPARTNGVDADVLRGVFDCRRFRQTNDGVFARAVRCIADGRRPQT